MALYAVFQTKNQITHEKNMSAIKGFDSPAF